MELVTDAGSAQSGRVVLAGEGMIELSGGQSGSWRSAYGGDTLNVAIHLARFGVQASYFSALGEDPLSAQLREAWQCEGVDTRLVLSDPSRRPGLYVIRTDESGERTFFFWRSESAARRMLSLPTSAAALAEVESADLFFYSLISLAILDPEGRQQLFATCRRLRARGGRVAFDGNYRPLLWASAADAIAARDQALAECDIGLPTLSDEQLLGHAGDAHTVAARWRARGVQEVVVKLGAAGCLADHTVIAPPHSVSAVDTSGAGDAFDAAYLAARLRGESIHEAALAGHRLAGWVVQRYGAIPPRDAAAPY